MGISDIFGGGGSSTSRQYIDPGQKPFLRDIYGQARDIYRSPSSQQLQQNLWQRAMEGSPFGFAAQNQLMDTLGGAYMPGSEPFGNQMQALYNQIRPSLDSQFAGAGRYGSGLHQIGAENRMADIGMGIMGDERNRMMQASQFAPQMQAMDFQNYAAPWMNLQNYAQTIGDPTVLGSSESSQTGGIFSPIKLF
jgi:hypothetical protein